MSELLIKDLHVSVGGTEILRGIDLRVASGEIHAVMGPNGSGKSTLSHVVAGRPGYRATSGQVLLDGADLLAMAAWERARAGLFLALQYPIEVPGVSLVDAISEAYAASGRDPADAAAVLSEEAERAGLDQRFLSRPLNVDLSGGERKRNEVVQLGALRPKFAVLDEVDSGLDVDALRAVARRVAELCRESDIGILAITHYYRLLSELPVDRVHVVSAGRVVASGGPELALELEKTGYAAYGEEEPPAPRPPVGNQGRERGAAPPV
ncbi:MAG: Fe-S cluster assembly ATPase SufC [Acidimicrobiales bacterium]